MAVSRREGSGVPQVDQDKRDAFLEGWRFWEALLKSWEESGGPGMVKTSSRKAKRGRECLPDGRNGLEGHPGRSGGVGRSFCRADTGREALDEGREGF